MTRRSFAFGIVLVGIFIGEPSLWAGPGFSALHRKTINLEVRKPALVRLADTSIAFTGKASNPEYQSVLQSLLTTIATELVKHENSLVAKPDPKQAEWTLYMQVTGYSAHDPQKSAQRAGDNIAVTDHWTGSLNVAYQVLDRNGRVHDADNITAKYENTAVEGVSRGRTAFGVPIRVPGMKRGREAAPQSVEDLKQLLVHRVSEDIASKLGNSSVGVSVKVATGEDHLNRAVTFMEQRLWARALQELESANAFPDADEESYRLYDLGLVYEAMSYEAKSYKDQRANLFQAQELYDKALETNRKEKYFVETVARVRDSIARYKTLDQQPARDHKAIPVKAATAREEGRPAPNPQVNQPTSASKANTAADIIKLFQAGVPNQQIVEIIRSAPLEFNPVDIPTVLAIREAKLPIDIQNEMRKKVGAERLRGVRSPPAKPAQKKAPAQNSRPGEPGR